MYVAVGIYTVKRVRRRLILQSTEGSDNSKFRGICTPFNVP